MVALNFAYGCFDRGLQIVVHISYYGLMSSTQLCNFYFVYRLLMVFRLKALMLALKLAIVGGRRMAGVASSPLVREEEEGMAACRPGWEGVVGHGGGVIGRHGA
jgi:hypothetical protein